MNFAEVVNLRHSVRGFLPQPVPRETLEKALRVAQQAPSNCNTQPWKVLVASGATRDRLAKALVEQAASGDKPSPDLPMDISFAGIYRERQVACAMELYSNLGIDRSDRPARDKAMIRNWEFFGAPHAIFLAMDKSLGLNSIMDVGIYFQTLMLALTDAGIACCPQLALAWYPGPIRAAFNLSDDYAILGGLSVGYEDPSAPANKTRLPREPLENTVQFAD